MEQIEATRHSLSTIEDGTSFYLKGLKFVCVCKSFPEAYDVFDENGIEVAYVRLRRYQLTCECFDEVIYDDSFDCYSGEFKSGRQRIKRLNKIADKILERLENNDEQRRNEND